MKKVFFAIFIISIVLNIFLGGNLYSILKIKNKFLSVNKYFPENVATPEETKEIKIVFDDRLNPLTVKENTIELSPFVKGATVFETPSTLIFRLDEPLKKASVYNIILSPELKGIKGESPLKGSYSFKTTPLKVIQASQASLKSQESVELYLKFNEPVNPLEAREFVEITYPDATHASFTVIATKPENIVRINIGYPVYDKINIKVRKGLLGIEGPLGLEKDFTQTINISAELNVMNIYPETSNDYTKINIEMNGSVNPSNISKFINIEPEVSFTIEEWYSGFSIVGSFIPGQQYLITLKEGLGNEINQLKKDINRRVRFSDMNSFARFSLGGGYLTPGNALNIPIRSVNSNKLSLTIQKLYPNNIVEFAVNGTYYLSSLLTKEPVSSELEIKAEKNKVVETIIDMGSLFKEEPKGVYGVYVKTDKSWNSDEAVYVVTDLGISARFSKQNALVWVSSIKTSKPVENVNITIYSDHRQLMGKAQTDEKGLCLIPITYASLNENPVLVIAEKDTDMSYLNLYENAKDRGSEAIAERPYLNKGYEAYIYTERGVYRPGDMVYISSLIRGESLTVPPSMPLNIVIKKPSGKKEFDKTILSDANGQIAFEYELRPDSQSGTYGVSLELPGKLQETIGECFFQVGDFMPQTIKTALNAPESPLNIENEIPLNVHSDYLFGEPAKDLQTKCRIFLQSALFQPKGFEDYIFGDLRIPGFNTEYEHSTLSLDDNGDCLFNILLMKNSTPGIIKSKFEVEVLEKEGRPVIEKIERDVFTYKSYLGVKRFLNTLQAKEKNVLEIIALDPNGMKLQGMSDAKLSLYKVTYSNYLRKSDNGRLKYDWVRSENLEAEYKATILDGSLKQELEIKFPGRYRLIAESQGMASLVYDFYVQGDGDVWSYEDPDKIQIFTDKEIYADGETANISITAPFDGTMLFCVESDKILFSDMIDVVGGKCSKSIKIEEGWKPNVYITGTLIRPVDPEADWKPHRAMGVKKLKVDSSARKIALNINAPDSVKPGEECQIEINALKEGVALSEANVTVFLVDEGVLKLSDYKTPSPFEYFYCDRSLGVREFDMYSNLSPVLSTWELVKKLSPGGDGYDEPLASRMPISLSRRVKTAVLLERNVCTDENGHAIVKVKIPEYIGELRVMAVCGNNNYFGTAEKGLLVKSPVMFRSMLPRFLSKGDECMIPVNIFNRTENKELFSTVLTTSKEVSVLETPEPVSIESGKEVMVYFKIRAEEIGSASIEIKTTAKDLSYKETIDLPVTPNCGYQKKSEMFKFKPGLETYINVPSDYLEKSQKTNIVFGGSPIIELSGIIQTVLNYPYGCLEQTITKLIPFLYLPDITKLTNPEWFEEKEIKQIVEDGLNRIYAYQNYSGGMNTWINEVNPNPYVSVYAADFMMEAKKAGYEIPVNLYEHLINYLETYISSWISQTNEDEYPLLLGEAAYAAYVLSKTDNPPFSAIYSIQEKVQSLKTKKISIPDSVYLHLALAYWLTGDENNSRKLLGENSTFQVGTIESGYITSKVKENAILLSVLLTLQPDSPKIPALAESLKETLKVEMNYSTHDYAYVLMALGKYARQFKTASNSKIKVTDESGVVAEFEAKDGYKLKLVKPGTKLKVELNGEGEIFAFMFTEGIPKSGTIEEKDSGISVRKSILDNKGNTVSDLTNLKQGELYRVKIKVNTSRNIGNVVICDLIPAGFEIENPFFKGSAVSANTLGNYNTHIEMLDDRLLLFSELPQGESDWTYVVRAVTQGEFNLLPAEVSCMYNPGLYSINGKGKIIVKK